MSYRGIQTDTISISGNNGDAIDAYLARPQGDGPFPGVVVVHHQPGWDEWTLEVCWKLAHRGYAAIAPHLYSRLGSGSVTEVLARSQAQGGASDDEVVGDIAGAAKYLKQQSTNNGKVGAIGFCSGGRQLFIAACKVPEIDASVNCWGGGILEGVGRVTEKRPIAPITYAEDLHGPILGLFGVEDHNPTPEEVDGIEEELKRLGKTYEFYRYEGAGHAFFTTDRHRYRPEQAVDAWIKIQAFFDRQLQGAGSGSAKFVGPSPKVSLSGTLPLR